MPEETNPAADTTTTQVETAAEQVNPIPVPHDRVGMLSLRADGTPDQTNPVIIGDPAAATASAKRQFTEQAIAAADEAYRPLPAGATTIIGTPDGEPDKVVPATRGEETALQAAHAEVAKAAEAAAEATVADLAVESTTAVTAVADVPATGTPVLPNGATIPVTATTTTVPAGKSSGTSAGTPSDDDSANGQHSA